MRGRKAKWGGEVQKGSARGGVIENGGAGMGGGGCYLFIMVIWTTERSLGSRRAVGAKISLYSENFALHQHISCKNKNKNNRIKLK